MNSGTKTTPRGKKSRRGTFAAVFLVTLVVLYGFLSTIGITPELRIEDTQDTSIVSTSTSVATKVELPVRISASSVGMNAPVLNPASTDVKVLDEALLSGAVRYPGSAKLGEEGNVLIFGHSSYLRTVFNESYKAFNDIQKLKVGETIKVSSGNSIYEYQVTSVRLAKAEEEVIDLSRNSRRLTLVTCNSFATKSDRFVVEAQFVKSYPLAR